MALPTLAKTWSLISNTIADTGVLLTNSRNLLKALKDAIVTGTGGWTVRSSNNGAGTFGNNDNVDRWTSTANLVWASGAVNHSWIVFQNSSGAQLCFDLNSANSYQMGVAFSVSAGFTGGTATARPTATDEHAFVATTTFGAASASSSQTVLHVWKSSDSSCLRWVMGRANFIVCMFHYDAIRNPKSGAPTRWWSYQATNVNASVTTIGGGMASGFIRAGGGNQTCWLTNEAFFSDSGNNNLARYQTVANEFTLEWDFYPFGLYGTTNTFRGPVGRMFDLWSVAFVRSNLDGFPSTGTLHQFVYINGFVYPNPNNVALTLT